MANVANTSWYRNGTVTVNNNSTKVIGSGTNWLTAGINPGATFRVDRKAAAYEVAAVVSNTELTLARPYYDNSGSGLTYSIDRNFQSTLNSRISASITSLLSVYEQLRDGVYLTIQGKDAYQVAVETGYTGTKAQWVESLKAAGELNTLLERTNILTYNNTGSHNASYRGKNLGTAFTSAQSAAIRAGTFDDIYVGDFWNINVQAYTWTDANNQVHTEAACTVKFLVADCDYFLKTGEGTMTTSHHVVIVPEDNLYLGAMNASKTTEGGYLGSLMYSETLKRARALFTAAFGADHILTYRDVVSNAVTDGKESGFAWVNLTVELMSESMVFGQFLRTAEYDYRLYTLTYNQLNLFRHNPPLIVGNTHTILRNVNSSTTFCAISANGASTIVEGDYMGGIRPFALIY